MNKIRILVVDDEPLARSNLIVLLRLDPEVESIDECGSGREAIEKIRANKPDLVFLDVQMPECDGFDVLELLGGDVPPAVIFVTAYDQYALKAFEAEALDYLLKPFDNARFVRALNRAKEQIAHRTHTSAQMRERSAQRMKRLMVKSAGRVSFLQVADIDWIEAADYYACLHIGTKAHLLRRTMHELDCDLDPAAFCRIHRSTIVNLNRIRQLSFDCDGEYEVVLADATRLRMSRRYHKILQSRLEHLGRNET
ncbi:MAG: two component transcriptional regulator, LytTR family [Edaphobacter sp.]|nr:two component transcriptional regulator, LytTR family [Edaphobacter sp.]